MKTPKGLFKANLYDWDRINTLSAAECCFSLTKQEVAMILTCTEFIGWSRRWFSETGEAINQDIIDNWQAQLEYKLMSGCCPDDDELHRYLPNGTHQSSSDGGATWHDDPTGDVRYGAPLAPPLPGANGDGKKCAAADNIREQYKQMRDNTIGLLVGGTTVLIIIATLLGLVSGILAVTITGAPFSVMLFGLAGVLLGLTPESVEDQLSDSVMDEFRCLVYCNLGDDGRLSAAGLTALLVDIADTFTGFPETFFYSITASLGATGISNGSTMGTATAADCEDCDCNTACIGEGAVIMGTIIEQTETYITLQGEFGTWNGVDGYFAIYGSMVDDYCCLMCSWQVLTGGLSAGSLVDCDGNLNNGLPDYKRRAEFRGTTADFTIKYTFDPEGVGCP